MKTVDFDILWANMGFSVRPCSRSSCHENSDFLGGPKFGACGVFRKERGLVSGTKNWTRVYVSKACLRECFSLLDTDIRTWRRGQHGKRLEAKDAPMRHVVGVLGTPEAMHMICTIVAWRFHCNFLPAAWYESFRLPATWNHVKASRSHPLRVMLSEEGRESVCAIWFTLEAQGGCWARTPLGDSCGQAPFFILTSWGGKRRRAFFGWRLGIQLPLWGLSQYVYIYIVNSIICLEGMPLLHQHLPDVPTYVGSTIRGSSWSEKTAWPRLVDGCRVWGHKSRSITTRWIGQEAIVVVKVRGRYQFYIGSGAHGLTASLGQGAIRRRWKWEDPGGDDAHCGPWWCRWWTYIKHWWWNWCDNR